VALPGRFENCPACGGNFDPRSLILILDMGASSGLTPFCSHFIDYVEYDVAVLDISKVNKVIVIRTTLHKITTPDGKFVFLPHISYHLPQIDLCLFSPQTYHKI
jgi:hypothetical protein